MSCRAPNQISTFVIGTDSVVYEKSWNSSTNTWNPGFKNLGGKGIFEPVSVSCGPDDLSVFIVGLDHALYHNYWNSSSGWSGFKSLGGLLTAPPAVSRRGDAKILDIFHIGREGSLYWTTWNGTAYINWVGLGGEFATRIPACVSWGSDHVAVFGTWSDGSLICRQWCSATQWSTWQKVSGMWTDRPKVVSDQPGNMDVFGHGTNHTVLNHVSFTGGKWRDTVNLPGICYGTPDAVSWGPGRIDLFILGVDSATYHASRCDGVWSSFTSLGGLAIQPPKAVTHSVGALSVFVIGTDSALYLKNLGRDNCWDANWQGLGGISLSRSG